MSEAFRMGGVMMWPLLFVGLGVVALVARGAIRLSRGMPTDGGDGYPSVLFWGVVAAVLGLLGTVIGLVQMSRAIARFGSVNVGTVADGFAVTLVTLIFGLLILFVALISWYCLKQWESRRGTRTAIA